MGLNENAFNRVIPPVFTNNSPSLSFLASTGACWLLIFPLRKLLLNLGVVDRPNARSSHNVPIVRGGGIAVVVIVLLWLSIGGVHELGLALPLLGLATLSFYDDCCSAGVGVRFAGQTIVAFAALAWLWHYKFSFEFLWLALYLPSALVWITGYTNGFNFMDGINGLAAGQALITALGTALLGYSAGLPCLHPGIALAVVIAGAAAGFLPHNYPHASVFLGDVGSASLGFLLSVLALWIARDAGWWLLIPLGLLHTNFILDTGITLARRMLGGERWYEAHREHFYQRLVRAGRSHALATSLEMGLQGVVVGLMILYINVDVTARLILGAGVIVIWLMFFAWGEVCFRLAQRKL